MKRSSRNRAIPAAASAAPASARAFCDPSPTVEPPSPLVHSFAQLAAPAGFEAPAAPALQAKGAENRTGLPDRLKGGLESLSGLDLSGVRVHRGSEKPARVQALAYTQGQNIHVAPGQEQHLPHEGWHAVQQMQGRVRPTMKAHGVAINDDSALEREADVMGKKALRAKPEGGPAD